MNKNIKKYSGLSMVMGTVLVLSGCGHVKSMKEDNLSNKVEVADVVDVVDVVDKKVNSTTTVLTTSVVTTTTSTSTAVEYENNIESVSEVTEEVEPFAYAGSRYEDNVESENVTREQTTEVATSSCTCEKDMNGQYAYLRYNDDYTITNEDSLMDLCDRFNITINEFYDLNKDVKSFAPGVVVKHPVMDELYIAKKGDSVTAVSIETGVDEDIIFNNNKLSNDIIESDTYLLLHKFNGDENSYVTNKGVVNIINNNRIYGNKIIQASGFAGASKKMLVLNDSVYSYGVNDVVFYTFDDDNNYTSSIICNNAKDIISVDGMPTALLRNESDIEALAASVGVSVDAMAYMHWESTVSDNCSVCTSGDASYVVMNGAEINNLDINNSYVKTK